MAVGSFNQKISLEGAEEILRQLQQLGAQGERAFQQLKTAAEGPNANLNRLSTSLAGARTAFTNLATAATTVAGSLGPVGQSISTISSLFASFRSSVAAGAAAAGGAAVLMARNFANTVVETRRMAAALGLSIEQLQGIQKAAKDAGLDVDTITNSITRFAGRVSSEAQEQFKALIDIGKQVSQQFGGNGIKFFDVEQFRQLREAAAAAAPQIRELFKAAGDPRANLPVQQFISEIERLASTSEEFRNQLRQAAIPAPALQSFERFDVLLQKNSATLASMGVQLVDANGNFRATGDVLLDTLDKIQKMPEGFQRTARAAQLFGRQAGPELASALTRGGIEAAIEKLRETGRVFDADAIQKALDAKKAFNDFDAAAGKLSKTLGSALLPTITGVLQELSGDKPIFTIEEGSLADSVFKAVQRAIPVIEQFFASVRSQSIQTWNEASAEAQVGFASIVSAAQAAASAIQAAWNAVANAISSALQQQSAIPEGGGGGFAAGGYTGNIGTGRIAGFVHGGEYVQPARVVRQPGVRAFMETLRRVGDLRTAIEMFSRGFSIGGFVDNINSRMASLAMPGFAGGGFVPAAAGGQLSNFGTVDLGIGGQSVRIMTDAESARAIRRVAMRNARLSIGKN